MHKRRFGWITIKIYNEIKGLKVPTYESILNQRETRRLYGLRPPRCRHTSDRAGSMVSAQNDQTHCVYSPTPLEFWPRLWSHCLQSQEKEHANYWAVQIRYYRQDRPW